VSDLLTLAREFDLPPKWNDCIVRWNGWEPQLDAIVCRRGTPQPRECCSACASPHPPATNRGYVALSPLTTPAMMLRNDEQRARLPIGQKHKVPGLVLFRLHAFRCQDCRHDVVWDIDTDEWWDLDHTDYGPEGSR